MWEYETRQKLQKLLDKLIDKGWKPFWLLNEVESIVVFDGLSYKIEINYSDHWHYKYLRQIVSKESMLWQFCVENRMVNGVDRWTLNAKQRSIYDKFITSEKEYRPYTDYQYWLIESSLVEEKDLAKFLLDNIILK